MSKLRGLPAFPERSKDPSLEAKLAALLKERDEREQKCVELTSKIRELMEER